MYKRFLSISILFLLLLGNIACSEDKAPVPDTSHNEISATDIVSAGDCSSECVSSDNITVESDVSVSNSAEEIPKLSGRLYKYDVDDEIKYLILTPESFFVLSDNINEEDKYKCNSITSGSVVQVYYQQSEDIRHPEIIIPKEISLLEDSPDMADMSRLQDLALNNGYFRLLDYNVPDPFLLISKAELWYGGGKREFYTYSIDGKKVMISYPLSEGDHIYYVPLITFSLIESNGMDVENSLQKNASIILKKFDKYLLLMNYTRYDYCFFTDDQKVDLYDGSPDLEKEKVVHVVSDEQLLEIMNVQGTLYDGYTDIYELRETFLNHRDNEDNDTVKWIYQVLRMLDRNMEKYVASHIWAVGLE